MFICLFIDLLCCCNFHLRPFKHIWHGSRQYGERHPKNCRSWLSESSEQFSTATALNGRSPTLDEREFPCSSSLIVLCVQVNPTQRRRRLRAAHNVLWNDTFCSGFDSANTRWITQQDPHGSPHVCVSSLRGFIKWINIASVEAEMEGSYRTLLWTYFCFQLIGSPNMIFICWLVS